MNVTRKDVYTALERSGGLDFAGLQTALEIPDGLKGTRAKLRTILTAAKRSGYVKKENGVFMMTGKTRQKGRRSLETDASVRRALESGIDTIYDISNETGYCRETVAASLKRMGAVKTRDSMVWHWSLPEAEA